MIFVYLLAFTSYMAVCSIGASATFHWLAKKNGESADSANDIWVNIPIAIKLAMTAFYPLLMVGMGLYMSAFVLVEGPNRTLSLLGRLNEKIPLAKAVLLGEPTKEELEQWNTLSENEQNYLRERMLKGEK